MYEYLVGEYLKKLKVDDILNYAKQNNFAINESDAIILLSYAKRYYKELMSDKPNAILKEIKSKINPETYKVAYKMYIEAKMKYLK
jgi:hypothetical protein